MNTDNLKTLLIKYDQKRNSAIASARQKKYEIFDKIPELESVENSINSLSIKAIQITLTSRDKKDDIDKINKEISELKKNRTKILKENNLSEKDFEPVFECKKCNLLHRKISCNFSLDAIKYY